MSVRVNYEACTPNLKDALRLALEIHGITALEPKSIVLEDGREVKFMARSAMGVINSDDSDAEEKYISFFEITPPSNVRNIRLKGKLSEHTQILEGLEISATLSSAASFEHDGVKYVVGPENYDVV